MLFGFEVFECEFEVFAGSECVDAEVGAGAEVFAGAIGADEESVGAGGLRVGASEFAERCGGVDAFELEVLDSAEFASECALPIVERHVGGLVSAWGFGLFGFGGAVGEVGIVDLKRCGEGGLRRRERAEDRLGCGHVWGGFWGFGCVFGHEISVAIGCVWGVRIPVRGREVAIESENNFRIGRGMVREWCDCGGDSPDMAYAYPVHPDFPIR